MDLKGRLALIASFVPNCKSVCDVGTDHGYIPVYLVKKGICQSALAMDINEGPLLAANENINYYGLQDKIETRLGNGLEPLNLEESDVIVIAGMGGILIKDILEASYEKAEKANLLILQPMNAIEILREWLYNNGFDIIDEKLTNEDEKIYNVLKVKWTGEKKEHEIIDYYIGRELVKRGGILFHTLLNKKLLQTQNVIEGLNKSTNPDKEYLKLQIYLKNNYERILTSIEGKEN